MNKLLIFFVTINFFPLILLSQSSVKDTINSSVKKKGKNEVVFSRGNDIQKASDKKAPNEETKPKIPLEPARKKDIDATQTLDTLKYYPDSSQLYFAKVDTKYLDSVRATTSDSIFINLNRVINLQNNRAVLEIIRREPPIEPPTSTYDMVLIFSGIALFLILIVIGIFLILKLRKTQKELKEIKKREKGAFEKKLFDELEKKGFLSSRIKKGEIKNFDTILDELSKIFLENDNKILKYKTDLENLRATINQKEEQISIFQSSINKLKDQIESEKNSFSIQLKNATSETVNLSKLMIDRYDDFVTNTNNLASNQRTDLKKMIFQFHISYTHISLALFRKFSNQNFDYSDLNIELLKRNSVSPIETVDKYTETGLQTWMKILILMLDDEKIDLNDAYIEGRKIITKD